MRTCTFFGHSDLELSELERNDIELLLDKMITTDGYEMFLFGGLGRFDEICWEIVTKLKAKHPHIRRVFCLTDPKHEYAPKRPRYLKDDEYDEFVYLPLKFDWWYKRIYFRNCEMIDRSDFVIFYVYKSNRSGSYKALEYAIKKKKEFKNFAEDKLSNLTGNVENDDLT